MTTPAVTTTERVGFGYSYGIFVSLDPLTRSLSTKASSTGSCHG